MLNVKVTPELDDGLVQHSSKNKAIFPSAEVHMLDYEFVEKCADKEVLCNILLTLKEGKYGCYPHLEQTVREKMFDKLEPSDKHKIIATSCDSRNENIIGDLLSCKRDVCDELGDWLDIMSTRKDCQGGEKVRNDNSSNAPGSIPPVRGSSNGATIVSNKSACSPARRKRSEGVQRKDCISKENMSNHDYFRAWDKFDVDAAEAAIDEEGEQPQINISAAKDKEDLRTKRHHGELINLQKELRLDSLSGSERRSFALREKQKGNECFRCGDNEDAVIFYSRSIAYNDNGGDAIVFANRAMASIRLGNYEQATTDCSESLRIDPTYTKALARKAVIHHKRGQYKEASMDFEECVRREPENKEYMQLHARSNQKLREMEGTRTNQAVSSGSYKRVLIEEMSNDGDDYIDYLDVEEGIDLVVKTPGTLQKERSSVSTRECFSFTPNPSKNISRSFEPLIQSPSGITEYFKVPIIECSDSEDEDSI